MDSWAAWLTAWFLHSACRLEMPPIGPIGTRMQVGVVLGRSPCPLDPPPIHHPIRERGLEKRDDGRLKRVGWRLCILSTGASVVEEAPGDKALPCRGLGAHASALRCGPTKRAFICRLTMLHFIFLRSFQMKLEFCRDFPVGMLIPIALPRFSFLLPMRRIGVGSNLAP
ncbi:hypothetical protein C8R43DRAFT_976410 [Mycena crocata]|nr:hypothetical protein C8R43DRAFT_976410 [Mycena crocata]